jgi:rhodanese-related sulfurtransferase
LIEQWRFCQLCTYTVPSDNSVIVSERRFTMPNAVTLVPAAPSEIATQHFESQLRFETDCWDTHEAMQSVDPGFVLLDVRAPALFSNGHVPGSVNLPQGKIVASRLADYPRDTLFVTYCAGPHCNGAARAAIRLSRLGYAVKVMAGGITGWLDEGFPLRREDAGT